MPPRSVWCFAAASACPFWCTLHPHPMFRWTFLSALVTFPSCSFGDSGAYPSPLGVGGRVFPLGPSLGLPLRLPGTPSPASSNLTSSGEPS